MIVCALGQAGTTRGDSRRSPHAESSGAESNDRREAGIECGRRHEEPASLTGREQVDSMTTLFLTGFAALTFSAGAAANDGPTRVQPPPGEPAIDAAAALGGGAGAGTGAADATGATVESAPDKIRFAAIVQFATKGADRVGARKIRAPLSFQDALYEGDRIRVAKGAHAKLALKSGCVLAVYGAAQAVAPNLEKPWRIRAEGLRAICPDRVAQPLSFRGSMIDVNGGEILISGSRLLILRGSPAARGLDSARPLTMFELSKGVWKAVSPAPTALEAFEFNQSRPAPKESVALEKPAKPASPKQPPTTRLMIGPMLGGGSFMHDHKAYNDSGMTADGGRIQAHFKSGDRSVIIAVTPFLSLDSRGGGPCHGNGCPPAPGESIARLELATLEAGLRFRHSGWWSPYARVGLMFAQNRVTVRETDGNFYHHRIEHYGITAAGGADAYWRPSWLPWFGLYANGEIFAARALLSGADRNESPCQQCVPPPRPPTADPARAYGYAGWSLGFGFFGQW